MSMNPYEILGVENSATEHEIKAAYKALVKETHPDKTNGDDEQFKKINMAYNTLVDPVKRKIYDETGVVDDLITQLAVTDLKNLIGKLSEQIKDPKELGTFDLIARIQVAVQNNTHQVDAGIAWLTAKIAHLEEVKSEFQNRLKRKTTEEAPDVFFSPVDALIKSSKEQMVKSENAKLVLTRIKELLAEYEYEFTPPPVDPAANGHANDDDFKVKLSQTLRTASGQIFQEGDVLKVIEKMADGSVIAAHPSGTNVQLTLDQFVAA